MTYDIKELLAEKLCDLMSQVSEDCWCAGWLIGLERSLYRIVFCGASRDFGMGVVSQDDVDKIKALAVESDSWWHWVDHEDFLQSGKNRISLAEAGRLYGGEP